MIKSISQFKRITCTIACLATSSLLPTQVYAQSSSLPGSTVEAITIGNAQQTQINSFIQSWTERALSGSSSDVKKAMEALVNPVHQRGVSIAFRQAYARSLVPLMDELEGQDSVGSKLSALRLAGALSTPDSASRVQKSLKDEDLGIQIFAVSRIQSIFSNTTKYSPAISSGEIDSLIGALEKIAMENDVNRELLRSAVRALIQGTTLTSKDMGNSRSTAIKALSNVVGNQLRTLTVSDDPKFAQTLAIQATSAITASILDISSSTTSDATREAVGLAGDTISITLRRQFGKTLEPVSQRGLTIKSVRSAESLLYFARRKHAEIAGDSQSSIRQTGFTDQLEAGDDRDFRNDASGLLGPGSDLIRKFSFADERFVR